jgi:hypothetical protein
MYDLMEYKVELLQQFIEHNMIAYTLDIRGVMWSSTTCMIH